MEKSCIRNWDSFSLIQLIPIRFKVKNIEPMDKILVLFRPLHRRSLFIYFSKYQILLNAYTSMQYNCDYC